MAWFSVQPVMVLKVSLIIKLGAGAFQENAMPDHKVFDRSLGFHRFVLGPGCVLQCSAGLC